LVNDAPLVELLHLLRLQGYRFTAVTPKTHATVLSRPLARPPDLRDIFGWNRPFAEPDLDPELLSLLNQAGDVRAEAGRLRSQVRVASLGSDLFVHSAFPTNEPDAVFFGPDTYRFASFIGSYADTVSRSRVIADMGTGSGAGAVVAARLAPNAEIVLVDVNPKALQFAQINAAAAELKASPVAADKMPDHFDLLIANPPYLMDPSARTYRHGGGLLGGGVALDWIRQGLEYLRPGGTILLYTGAAFVGGQSPLLEAVSKACQRCGVTFGIEEIDPDVFGEELAGDAYDEVERIAVTGIRIFKP
jgi:methylase of polypeptide subunit release factors